MFSIPWSRREPATKETRKQENLEPRHVYFVIVSTVYYLRYMRVNDGILGARNRAQMKLKDPDIEMKSLINPGKEITTEVPEGMSGYVLIYTGKRCGAKLVGFEMVDDGKIIRAHENGGYSVQ